MQKKLFILFLLFLPFLNYAQDLYPKEDLTFNAQDLSRPPLAKGCKPKGSLQDQKDCTSIYINDYVNRHFNTRLAERVAKKKHVELNAEFIITKEGKIAEVKVEGGPEKLNSHLKKIILSLKDFQPAMKDGTAVDVLYSLPVNMRFF